MKNHETYIKEALNSLAGEGIAPPSELNHEIQEAFTGGSPYRVAIVGKYQVGKSCLINRVFIGEKILPEGYGLPTSSVNVGVTYGAERKATIRYWLSGSGGQGKNAMEVGVSEPEIISNPSAERLLNLITDRDEVKRAELAEKTHSIYLECPESALKNYVVFDTPGLDDPNPKILVSTTLRVVPSADIAILVMQVRQLDTVELDFLRQGLFGAGISRLMILVSYNQETGKKSAESRKEVLQTIRAQLANIGRSHIPVQMYCYDPNVDGEILNNPRAINQEISDFARKNCQDGRIEKVVFRILTWLNNTERELSLKLEMSRKSEAERQKALDAIKEARRKIEDKYDEIKETLEDGITQIKKDFLTEIRRGLDRLQKKATDRLDKVSSPSQYADLMEELQGSMQSDINDLITEKTLDARRDIKNLEPRFRKTLTGCLPSLEDIPSLSIDGGFFASLPPLLITLSDYALIVALPLCPALSIPALPSLCGAGTAVNIALVPLKFALSFVSPIVEISGRFLAGQIKALRKFTPSGMVVARMVSNAKESLKEGMKQVYESVKNGVDNSFDDTLKKLSQAVKALIEEELNTAANSISDSSSFADDQARISIIERQLQCIRLVQEKLQ